MNYECPNCKSENIQKLLVAHIAGKSKTKSSGIGFGIGHSGFGNSFGVGVGVGKAENQTLLSQTLSPPKPVASVIKSIVILIAVFFAAFPILLLLGEWAFKELPRAAVWAILIVSSGLAIFVAIEEWDRDSKNDHKNLNGYRESYICLRCGKIFRLQEDAKTEYNLQQESTALTQYRQ